MREVYWNITEENKALSALNLVKYLQLDDQYLTYLRLTNLR